MVQDDVLTDGEAAVDDVQASGAAAAAALGAAEGAGRPGAGAAGDDAARELAEHNALARVFDDVRAQSRDGRLVTPDRWVELGLVPDHMGAEEFGMFVYAYWELEQEAAGEGASAAAGSEVGSGIRGDSLHVGGVHAGLASLGAVSSATRGVGVPPFMRNAGATAAKGAVPGLGANGDGGSSADAGVALRAGGCGAVPAAVAPAAEARGSAVAPASGETRAASSAASASAVASDVASDEAPTFDEGDFAGLDLPPGYELAQIEGEWVLVPASDEEPAELEVDCENVVALVGATSYYLYDRSIMTDAYAHWAFLAAEDDDLVTFVDCVREESRVYPRPMPVDTLRNEPFGFTEERIMDTWEAVRASGEYPDIKQVAASNGDVYFFSTKFLTRVHAQALAEWSSVERLRNV